MNDLLYQRCFNHVLREAVARCPECLRYFCRECGSPLWAADPRWAEWIFPYASAVNTPLPVPPETVHIMLDFKAPWIEVPTGKAHKHFDRYPDESIIDWHQRHGLYIE